MGSYLFDSLNANILNNILELIPLSVNHETP